MNRKNPFFILTAFLTLALSSCATSTHSATKPTKIIKIEGMELNGSKVIDVTIEDVIFGILKDTTITLNIKDEKDTLLGKITVKTNKDGHIFIKNLPDNFASYTVTDPEIEKSLQYPGPSKYDGIYDLCIKKGKKNISSAKVGDTITVCAKVRPKYYSSNYLKLSIYICDADGNKLFDHFEAPDLMDYKITGKIISYDWKVNISEELSKNQSQPLYCYFSIYADNFYHSDSIEIVRNE